MLSSCMRGYDGDDVSKEHVDERNRIQVWILFIIEVFTLLSLYSNIIKLIDKQLIVGWGTDSSNTEVLDFTTIPYIIIVSCSHMNYPWFNFGNDVFRCNYFMFLIIKSGFLFMWSAQPSILTVVIIMLDDYFKTNPGVNNLPWPGIEPQSPSPQPVVVAMSYNNPKCLTYFHCEPFQSI